MITQILKSLQLFFSDRKKAYTFSYCLLFSVFLWTIVNFTTEKQVTLKYKVNYVNIPPNLFISTTLPDTIAIIAKTSLVSLLKSKWDDNQVSFDMADLKSNKMNDLMLNNADILANLLNQLPSLKRIVSVSPKLIQIQFNEKFTKKVPVKLNALLNYSSGYFLTSAIKIMPQYINIYGDSITLAAINEIETENLVIRGIDNNIVKSIGLKKDNQGKLDYSLNVINVNINVSKYSEAQFAIPINLINVPKNKSMRIYPNTTQVKMLLPMNDYKNYSAIDFNATVNYADYIANTNLKKLRVTVKTTKENVKNMKLNIETVEYIFKN